MGKIIDDKETANISELLSELKQIKLKINSAKVLNGGFDRLEIEVSEVKKLQNKLSADFDVHKEKVDRIENKLERLFDPEGGIYMKVQKAEMTLGNLEDKITSLISVDEKVSLRLTTAENNATGAFTKINEIQKITGDNHTNLIRSIKLSKGIWWFAGFAATGFLSALGKLLWDYFTV